MAKASQCIPNGPVNFDGKDYPVTGDATADTRAYRRSNDRTLTFTAKKGTQVVNSGRVVVATDRKSRTVTQTGTNPNGRKFRATSVYDKQ